MRVTKQSLINSFLKNLNDTNSKLLQANKEVSSGKRVERPEDDSIAAAAITRLKAGISETVQYQNNIMHSLSELNTVDTVLGDISSILMRTRELAVQAANDTLSQAERDAIAVEVNQLLESMVQIGNSTMAGKSLFGGHESTSDPFDIIRGSDVGEVRDVVTIDGEVRSDINANNITRVEYKGDAQKTSIEVDQTLTVNTNLTGHDLFFYDDKISNESSRLTKKEVGITGKTLLENIVNARNKTGVSAGYIYVKNTSALHLRENTSKDPALDNSTPVGMLNNRRGIGRDNYGNPVGFGHIRITDSSGSMVTIDTTSRTDPNTGAANALPDLTSPDATLEDVITYLNAHTWPNYRQNPPNNLPAMAPSASDAPKIRFYMESGEIRFTDNAKGTGIPKVEDEDGKGSLANPSLALPVPSTIVNDLGLSKNLVERQLDAAVTPVGMMNGFGGVRFSSLMEQAKGRLNFTTGDFIEVDFGSADAQPFVYDDGSGNRTTLNFNFLPGTTSIQDVLDTLNATVQPSPGQTFANLDTTAGLNGSYFDVVYQDGTSERLLWNTMAGGGGSMATPSGQIIPGLSGATATLEELELQLRNRATRNDLGGRFTLYLNDGSGYTWDLGKTDLTQRSTLNDVVNELNLQAASIGVPGAPGGFTLSSDGQKIILDSVFWSALPSQPDSIVDLTGSTAAFDLGLGLPAINQGFPNLVQTNEDFPGLNFDERTTLREWMGEFGVRNLVNGGKIRIQNSAGSEYFIDPSNLHDQSTVGDFLDLIHASDSSVRAEISPNGYGLRFVDDAEGTGNFFVEDYGGSHLVEALGLKTPYRGAKEEYDASAGILINLDQIGNRILDVEDLLEEINLHTKEIGVMSRMNADTGTIIFEDTRASANRGKYMVSVENAVGLKTGLETLNDGGGINNYKIRITDSAGTAQIIDFQQAQTIEDVINAINLTNEEINEKTQLGSLEGISFPLGTMEVSSSVATSLVDLSLLNESSSVQDLLASMKQQMAPALVDVELRLDQEKRTLYFEFIDISGSNVDGSVSIKNMTGTTAIDLKMMAIAQASPFESGLIVHKRIDVTASLNDARTGIKIVDNKGGRLTITEVEGRTTAHDLGLIAHGLEIATSSNGVVVGRDLNSFEKIADELGLGKNYSRKIYQNEEVGSERISQGALNNQYLGIQSKTLKTIELSTLRGAVDMDAALNEKTRLDHLNNAMDNPEYKDNFMTGIDLSGMILIENINDDGNGNFQSIQVDLKKLPDNPTWKDFESLIQEEIKADDLFQARITTEITQDGKFKLISDLPVRLSAYPPSPAAQTPAGAGANTMIDIFGPSLDPVLQRTDFSRTITSQYLALKREMTGGIDTDSFYINDLYGGGSLEVDLNHLISDYQERRKGIELGDVKEYIEYSATKPAKLELSTSLRDLGVSFPLSIPYDATNPVQVDTVTPFNALHELSTLGDFLSAFNDPAYPLSAFSGVVNVQIADGINSSPLVKEKKLVVIDQTGLTNGQSLEIHGIPKELNDLFDQLGIKLGGQVSELAFDPFAMTTVIGMEGFQITGLGFETDFRIDSQGFIEISGQGILDDNKKPIGTSGRIQIAEGKGSTATDLKLIEGTGAIGDRTKLIHSGDLNPGVDRSTLMSSLNPKAAGYSTSFADELKKIYVENGKEGAFINLQEPPVAMETPLKAFNSGYFDPVAKVNRGGVDVGRMASGFIIEDQLGNKAVVDLSNDLSPYQSISLPSLTAVDNLDGTTRFYGAAGQFTSASGSLLKVGDWVEIAQDPQGLESKTRKFKVLEVSAAGANPYIRLDVNASTLQSDNTGPAPAAPSGAGVNYQNYTLNGFSRVEDLFASMEKEYAKKPFYNQDSSLVDLQVAINIAIDKAKRTTGFGVDQITVAANDDGSFQLNVTGQNGPTITISERDVNGDGILDSSTAGDLALLRESGAKGNGSPVVVSGKIGVAPTLKYIIDTINRDLSDVNVTASIGNSGNGPTLDITSNTNSSYLKVRDTLEGNSASQLGMSSTRSIFQTMIDFRDSMYRGDGDIVATEVLKKIKSDEERILQYRAQVGSVVNRFEINSDRLDSTKIELNRRLSDNQDLNLTDAIIELRQLENAQQAALNVGSRILQQSLLDFLR